LLLVGAILSFLTGLFLIAYGLWAGQRLQADGLEMTSRVMYAVALLGVVSLAGGEFGLRAYRAARLGDASRAFSRGLAAALLPPLQPIPLIGAILCKTSAEGVSRARPDDHADAPHL
jgi:hypothetical protein